MTDRSTAWHGRNPNGALSGAQGQGRQVVSFSEVAVVPAVPANIPPAFFLYFALLSPDIPAPRQRAKRLQRLPIARSGGLTLMCAACVSYNTMSPRACLVSG